MTMPDHGAISAEARAMMALKEAYECEMVTHRITMLSNEPMPGMSIEQLGQRRAVLGVAISLLKIRRNAAMDEAVNFWKAYKTLTHQVSSG